MWVLFFASVPFFVGHGRIAVRKEYDKLAAAHFRKEYLQLAEWAYGIAFKEVKRLPEKQVSLLELSLIHI